MPIVGEEVFFEMAHTGEVPVSLSWRFEFPPSNALAKIGFTLYMPYGEDDMVATGISNFTRRLPSGADQVVDNENQPAVGDGHMTAVTAQMYISNCQAQMLLVIEFWE
jgi:hypothetical protein